MSDSEMPAHTRIFVEGKDDKQFLEAYLKHLSFAAEEFPVDSIDGGDNTNELREKAGRAIVRGQTVLVIFDANSNPAGAREKIAGALRELPHSHFLFPDNESNGALEDLLEKIIKPEHRAIFDCFEEYKECIESKGYKAPSHKAKIYAYQWSHGLRTEERDRGNRHFDPDCWNFDSGALEPLKDFLSQHLTKKP